METAHVPPLSKVLLASDGVEIDHKSEGTGDWGLSLSLCFSAFGGTAAIITRMLQVMAGELRSVKAGEIFVSSLP